MVSLNLPVAGEAVGARASRTTHPLALHDFPHLYGLVLERPLPVDNPFIHLTKTEVLRELARHGHERLVGHACWCAHQGYGQTRLSLHCGTCSQCIDRRFAVPAAGLQDHDPEWDHRTHVFRGQRDEGDERNMAVNSVRHAIALDQMTAERIAAEFTMELSRAARFAGRRSEEADRLTRMSKRHADTVCGVLAEQIRAGADRYVTGGLPDTSLLRLVAASEHHRPGWELMAARIAEVLQAGVPAACRKKQPRTEPALQLICDGPLEAADVNLHREYPFMKWGWATTKPDWSSEPHRLWVELNSVRPTASAASVGEAIAADITRSGDNGQRVLFVIHDPAHLIPGDADYIARTRRPAVQVVIIR